MSKIVFNVYSLIVVIFWLVTVWIIVISSVGGVVSPLTEKQKKAVSFFFPEGWGFFTKDPRSETLIDVYKVDHNRIELINITNTSSENIMGLSRKSRFMGAEYSKLFVTINGQVSPKKWAVVEGWLEKKILPNERIKLNSLFNFKYIKPGEYLIVRYQIVPWAWAKRGQDKYNKFWLLRFSL